MADTSFEIIGIHDAESLAEGYNRGILKARGEILILSHDDILICDPNFTEKIIERLKTFDLLGFAGTSKLVTATWFGAGQPHLHGAVCHAEPKSRTLSLSIWGASQWPIVDGIKAVDGLCMITKNKVAAAIGFDALTFDGFHLYDIDFSFSCHLAGYKLGVCCDIPIIHESSGHFDHVHQKFALRFLEKHHDKLDLSSAGLPPPAKRATGRAAMFQDINELRRSWRPDIFRRATRAIIRQQLANEKQLESASDWWEKYLQV